MLLYFTTTSHKRRWIILSWRQDSRTSYKEPTKAISIKSFLNVSFTKELQNAQLSSNYTKKNSAIFNFFYVLMKLLKTVFVCTIEKLYSKDALITSVSKSQCVKMQIAIIFRLWWKTTKIRVSHCVVNETLHIYKNSCMKNINTWS